MLVDFITGMELVNFIATLKIVDPDSMYSYTKILS